MGKARRIVQPQADRCWRCNSLLRPDMHVCLRCGATRGTTHMQAAVREPRRSRRPLSGGAPGTDRLANGSGRYSRDGDQGGPNGTGRYRQPDTTRRMRGSPEDLHYDEPEPGTSGGRFNSQYRPGTRDPALMLDDIVRESRKWQAARAASEGRLESFPKRRNPQKSNPIWAEHAAILSVALVNVFFPVLFGLLGGFIGAVIWCSVALWLGFDAGFVAILMGYLTGQGVAMGSSYRGLRPTLLAMTLAFAGWAICEVFLGARGIQLLPLDGAYLLATLVAAILPTRSLPASES